MKVDRVGVSLVYAEGGKRVELKAEAVPDDRQTWQQAVVTLNHQLGLTMKGIWGQLPDDDLLPEEWEVPQARTPSPSEALQAPTPSPPDHWCEKHSTDWKKRNNRTTGDVFYSHLNPDKTWCNQPA